jgi:hypothetical protein
LKYQLFPRVFNGNVERVDTVSNLFRSTLEVTISNSYGGYGPSLGYLRNNRAKRFFSRAGFIKYTRVYLELKIALDWIIFGRRS